MFGWMVGAWCLKDIHDLESYHLGLRNQQEFMATAIFCLREKHSSSMVQ